MNKLLHDMLVTKSYLTFFNQGGYIATIVDKNNVTNDKVYRKVAILVYGNV